MQEGISTTTSFNIPPTTSSPSGYSANNPLWHCTLEEYQRGTNLVDQINESNYGGTERRFHQISQLQVHHY